MAKINSKNKGKRGELEFAKLCKEHGYENARRSQQIERDKYGRFIGDKNIYVKKNDTYECYHKGKKIFIIDAEDYEKTSKHQWYEGQNGYIYKSGTGITLHRFIMNAKEGDIIDHIDRVKSNNRKANLRYSDKSLNAYNSKVRSTNTSGVTGVYFRKDTKRWCACIRKNYKKIALGCFATKDEAIKARKEAESKYIDWNDVNG